MNCYQHIIEYIIPATVISLLVLLICFPSGVIGDTPDDKDNPDFIITNITLSPEELKVSPGMKINPTITIKNFGEDSKPDTSLKFSATLGPATLVNDNTSLLTPKAGEEQDYLLTFSIPFLQPGEYPFEICVVHDDKSGSGKDITYRMKFKKPLLVTHPTVSGASDCGCS